MIYPTKSIFLFIFLLLFFNPGTIGDDHMHLPTQTVVSSLGDLDIAQRAKEFILQSQDNATFLLPSMDFAYYIGMGLHYLDTIQGRSIPETFVNQLQLFLESTRNDDGSYGNWANAIGSMESTFQAVILMETFSMLDNLQTLEVVRTAEFIAGLKSAEGGYYPLKDWNAPDMTSTYRALKMYAILDDHLLQTDIPVATNEVEFIDNNYVDPFFINGASGFSETKNGAVELLATTYAVLAYQLLDMPLPHTEAVTKYLGQLSSTNGGIAGNQNGLPTTGFTYRGLQLYLSLNASSHSVDLDTLLGPNFATLALQYIQANKNAGEGFTSSDRDTTAEKSSTYFALAALHLAQEFHIDIVNLDLDSTSEYLLDTPQALYGLGNYPGDRSELSYTARGLAGIKLVDPTYQHDRSIKTFVNNAYDPDDGGFGYRPSASPRVKYTYYGIKALRELNDPILNREQIINFILATQNPDEGFGERPGSTISYMTHTYWALASLQLLGERIEEHINETRFVEFLSFYRNPDGTYSNYPGLNSSIISTYRGIFLAQLVGQVISQDDEIYSTLLLFQKDNGGFVFNLGDDIPTAEATFFGVTLAKLLNITIDFAAARNYVLGLQNPDGGFGIEEGFSSRLSSTYFCLSTLYLMDESQAVAQEDVSDIFSPLLYPSFNPISDTNKSFFGSYLLRAEVYDPESDVASSWVDIEWMTPGKVLTMKTYGRYLEGDRRTYVYTIGPFNQEGYIKFRFGANDTNGNIALSEWFSLITTGSVDTPRVNQARYTLRDLVSIIPLVFVLLSVIDGSITFRQRRNYELSDVKMRILENEHQMTTIASFNIVYLFLVMAALSYMARLFLGDAQLILENSLFLFRFLLAALIILFARYVVGIDTYGFFGTSVLALSWLQLGPLWGFLIFLNVFTLAYIARKLIDPYQLAVGFRVGMVMVFTITSLAVFELVGEIFRIEFLTTSILLPIIITPWMTDRYVQTENEESSYDAFLRLGGTVVVIALSYAIMSYDPLVLFITLNPETWVGIIAIIFYLGRSRYYTLFDIRRFGRLFSGDEEVLAILSRNRDYIGKYNDSVLFPVINKFNLKQQFDAWRVPNPELYGVISQIDDIDRFIQRAKTEQRLQKGFVIKPSESFGGRGIVVVNKVVDDNFIIGEDKYSDDAIRNHTRRIMQGEYLTSQTNSISDIVLLEEKIVADHKFGALGLGLPDIRVILFLGIPVMAMARIPTLESDGLANLKQGAIGAAISIYSGRITRAEWKQHRVTIHPDTNQPLVGFEFSDWNQILATSCLAQKSTGLGYAGVDLVLDESGRIFVLEVNKRPGLEIQNINLKGILERLEMIENEGINGMELSPLKCVSIARDLARGYWEVES